MWSDHLEHSSERLQHAGLLQNVDAVVRSGGAPLNSAVAREQRSTAALPRPAPLAISNIVGDTSLPNIHEVLKLIEG